MQKQTHLLPHIQILRAISVILVFFYHLKIDFFSKGYLGVDIFFVISGYVITNKLLNEYFNKSEINLINFYINRFWRIFPNLLFVLLTVFIFYKFFGLPDKSLFNDFIFSVIGISNLYSLVKDVDYFDNVFDNPLGHTWSLGIEEQFYILYPLVLIFLLFKIKNLNLISIFLYFIGFLIFSSLFIFELTNSNIFYNPFYRFWEFLIGCSIPFLRNIKKNFTVSKYIFYLSLVLMLTVLFLNLNIPYLLNNLLITFAAGFYLFFYNSNYFSINFFSNRFLVNLGNMSYSIYLWHLPIIYFSKIYFNSISYYIIVFLLTYFFSFLSFRYVESYFRFNKINTNKKSLIYFAVTFAFIFIFFTKVTGLINITKISSFFISNNYLQKNYFWNERTSFRKMKINEYEVYDYCTEDSNLYTKNNFDLRIECLKSDVKDEIYYLRGNSYVAQFIPIFNKSRYIKNLYYVHRSSNSDVDFNELKKIKKIYKKVFFVTAIDDISTFNEVLTNFEINSFSENYHIIFIGPIPNFYSNHLNPLTCMVQKINCTVKKNFDAEYRNLKSLINSIEKISKKHENIHFYNPYDFLCPDEECLIYDKDKDKLMLRDDKHLSFEGSIDLLNNFNDFIKTKIKK